MSSPFKLLRKPIHPSSLLCRGCLAESGEMKNMFDWCINEDFVKFTEVQLNSMGNISVLLCTKCEELLQNCTFFRQQCQNSNELLNNMLKNETKQNNIEYILTEKKLTYILSLSSKEMEPSLPCPFNCKKTYTKQILMQHLVNEHNVKSGFDVDYQYHCVNETCRFHVDSLFYFNDIEKLNTHYYEDCVRYKNCVTCKDSDNCKCFALERDKKIGNTAETKNEENTIESTLLENELILKITAPNTDSKIYLPCPYKCRNGYIKKKDLLTHLRKLHNKDENFTINLQYYCSISNCFYHLKSPKEMYFSERKFLNQHHVKKHKTKDFACIECSSEFVTENEFNRHKKYCNLPFICEICSNEYKTHERWLVHVMRKHPQFHKKYKDSKKSNKRKSITITDSKKQKNENVNDFICDSPKRSFATQTNASVNIRNDVTLPSWIGTVNTKKDEISTQTGFEDILSIKSQNSEDDSLFCSETVSLSDIQTQTPFEFGLSRFDKEAVKDIKETQTCVCLYESPKNLRIFEGQPSSPSINLTSTETQTADVGSIFTLNNIETQTCFDEGL